MAPADVAEFVEGVLLPKDDVESAAARTGSPEPVARRVRELADRSEDILDAARRASQVGGGVRIRIRIR
ncbi:hypothetical protein ACWGKU_28285 [Kitasatospora sp. NPDC054768]